MYGSRYSVPIILTDCSPSEALLQSFDNLQHLDTILTDIFTKLTNRIESQKTVIANIVNRISAAGDKVVTISQNQSKATTIFSSCKYPAPAVLTDYQRVLGVDQSIIHPIYDSTNPAAVTDLTESETPFINKIRSIPHSIPIKDRFSSAIPADTSQLFTTLTKARIKRGEHISDELAEGLGRLPSYLPSISSLLLFNSDENPYKQYVSVNNLEGSAGQDRSTVITGPSAAPKSLIDGTQLPTFAGYQFEYKPLLGELPTFNVPQNLPLGRIADISFGSTAQNQSQQSIAPSLANLNLPTLDVLASLPTPNRVAQPVSTIPNNLPAPPGPPSASAAAPPPPPSNIPLPPGPPMSAPSAPPAPPISAPNAPAAPPPPTASVAPKSAKPAASSSRGALLDAIRDAGNSKKLKKVAPGAGVSDRRGAPLKKKSTPAKSNSNSAANNAGAAGGDDNAAAADEPAPVAESGGGDLMSALRERLARRHTAISGKHNIENTTPAPSTSSSQSEKPGIDQLRKLSRAPRLGTAAEDPAEAAAKHTGILKARADAHSRKTANEEEW